MAKKPSPVRTSFRKSIEKKQTSVSKGDRKSVAGSSTTRKKKKNAGMDEESKAKIAAMEVKIEDLRKQSFGEINRLEAFIEKYKEDQSIEMRNLFDQLKSKQTKSASDLDELRMQLGSSQEKIKYFGDQLKKFHVTFKQFS